ncbi:delta-like protein [Plakobranchus ocellatus]|uniref:Delta-like protein n=1 Tax=Plakobranchus ocellatus TaxID=259542 RepID=A0AAV4D3X3_9GAST|nr:delta-like protein [Plakobranchus ocellatus]
MKKLIGVIVCLFIDFILLCFAQDNVMVGLQYKNYTNYEGTVADGTCCDANTLTAPHCPADQCDTSFLPCATYVGGQPCKAYFTSATPVMFDNNSFVLDDTIGNMPGNSSPTFQVFRTSYSQGDIQFNIVAREVTGGQRAVIANFSFTIDWMDTYYSDPPFWRKLLLKDTHAELGLDVFYQCIKSFFGPTCDIYCKPTPQYTCLNNGSKNCTEGWMGVDCQDLVPYCKNDSCQNLGTCVNIHLGYTCICNTPYTGLNCETDLSSMSTGSTTANIAVPSTTARRQSSAASTATPSATTSQQSGVMTTTQQGSVMTKSQQGGVVTTSQQSGVMTTTQQGSVMTTTQQSGVVTTTAVNVPAAITTAASKSTPSASVLQVSTTPGNPHTQSGGNGSMGRGPSFSGKTSVRKTTQSSGSEDVTAAVASSVSVVLGLLASLAAAAFYYIKRKKRREKVSPSPDPSTESAELDSNESPSSQSMATNSEPPVNHRMEAPATAPVSATDL